MGVAAASGATQLAEPCAQEWNLNKRLERWTKIILKGRWAKGVRDGMSAIEPLTYKGRFLAGMSYQFGLRDYQSDGHQRV